MPINIHIEHLVVEGSPFAASDAAAFRSALERELAAVAAATDAAGWPPARRTSVQAPAISPAQPSLSSWAADSARSLIAAVTPATC
jgi:hypothetical protein